MTSTQAHRLPTRCRLRLIRRVPAAAAPPRAEAAATASRQTAVTAGTSQPRNSRPASTRSTSRQFWSRLRLPPPGMKPPLPLTPEQKWAGLLRHRVGARPRPVPCGGVCSSVTRRRSGRSVGRSRCVLWTGCPPWTWMSTQTFAPTVRSITAMRTFSRLPRKNQISAKKNQCFPDH